MVSQCEQLDVTIPLLSRALSAPCFVHYSKQNVSPDSKNNNLSKQILSSSLAPPKPFFIIVSRQIARLLTLSFLVLLQLSIFWLASHHEVFSRIWDGSLPLASSLSPLHLLAKYNAFLVFDCPKAFGLSDECDAYFSSFGSPAAHSVEAPQARPYADVALAIRYALLSIMSGATAFLLISFILRYKHRHLNLRPSSAYERLVEASKKVMSGCAVGLLVVALLFFALEMGLLTSMLAFWGQPSDSLPSEGVSPLDLEQNVGDDWFFGFASERRWRWDMLLCVGTVIVQSFLMVDFLVSTLCLVALRQGEQQPQQMDSRYTSDPTPSIKLAAIRSKTPKTCRAVINPTKSKLAPESSATFDRFGVASTGTSIVAAEDSGEGEEALLAATILEIVDDNTTLPDCEICGKAAAGLVLHWVLHRGAEEDCYKSEELCHVGCAAAVLFPGTSLKEQNCPCWLREIAESQGQFLFVWVYLAGAMLVARWRAVES